MKRKIVFLAMIAAALGSQTALTRADKVQITQLPAAAQQVVRARAGSAQIEDIDRTVRNGVIFYEVAFKQNGQPVELRVDSNGTLLDSNLQPLTGTQSSVAQSSATVQTQPPGAAVPATTTPQLPGANVTTGAATAPFGGPPAANVRVPGTISRQPTFSDPRAIADTIANYPVPVQKTIRVQVGDGKIDLIQKEALATGNVYKLGFMNHGQRQDLRISESGAILDQNGNFLVTSDAVPLRQTAKVRYSDLPAPAQWTIQSQSGGARIEDLGKGTWQGRTIYQAAFRQHGKRVDLQVADNGEIIRSALLNTAKAPAVVTAAPGTAQARAQAVTAAVLPLSGATKVTFQEVPAAVQAAIRSVAGSAAIEDIDKGTWSGRTIYQAAFKMNGVHTEVQVAEDGTIMNRPIGAAAPAQPGANVITQPAPLTPAAVPQTWAEGSQKMNINELPAAVRDAIFAQTGGARIEDIDRNTKQGATTFQAAFHDQNGKLVEVTVDAHGKIIKVDRQ